MNEIAKENLLQITDLLMKLKAKDYTEKLKILSEATIGQHIRHILEFYEICLQGIETGTVCYDNRQRNLKIETEIDYAINVINDLINRFNKITKDTPLLFETVYNGSNNVNLSISSTAFRELAYCVEHSIHHQALIKSGLLALNKQDLVAEEFGVAFSTIQYRKSLCVQ